MKSSAGFTLIEMLVATAIASAIILSSGMLIHQTVFFFDRGTEAVDRSEELALATDSLMSDFAAVRFVVTKTADGSDGKLIQSHDVKASFIATAASEDNSATITFITGSGRGMATQGEEVVQLTVVDRGDETELVRRRGAWPGPIVPMEMVSPEDPVILLEGSFRISFSFAELTKAGDLVWYDRWTGERGLPYSVRMNLKNRVTDTDLFPAVAFRIRADAPPSCTIAEDQCYVIADGLTSAATGTDQTSQANAVER